MSKKPSLGFPTQKQAREAVQAIVNQYGLEQEFFHPLLQRLFIEQPYWCEPPGETFTKFKWTKHTLPNGATTERWFKVYHPVDGWIERSWRKALLNKPLDAATRLTEYARFYLIMPIVSEYRDTHQLCEQCKLEGRFEPADHVHHTIPVKTIIDGAIAQLTSEELAALEAFPLTPVPFTNGGEKFRNCILKSHERLDLLVALCRRHHNDAHGKETHTS